MSSAEKKHRQAVRRRARNRPVRTASRSRVAEARQAIAADAGSPEAGESVRRAISALDGAARKGVIHRNNAARRKSRLMRRLNKATAQA